ncbi:DUF6228 family protein [Streptomyces flaveolus]|uniref:DUF6228 family protein n=1 Tax=Streptomyces flaveolus TaxID=67297 RepID=UPI003F4CCEAD
MSLIEVGPGQVEVAVGGSGALAPRVRLFDWARADEYESAFAVEAVADGMRAQLENVTVTVWDDMSAFFDGLAGLPRLGRRTGLEHQPPGRDSDLQLGGHVSLGWTLRPDPFSGDWTCTVTTMIEAGEGMTAVAEDLRTFLHQG